MAFELDWPREEREQGQGQERLTGLLALLPPLSLSLSLSLSLLCCCFCFLSPWKKSATRDPPCSFSPLPPPLPGLRHRRRDRRTQFQPHQRRPDKNALSPLPSPLPPSRWSFTHTPRPPAGTPRRIRGLWWCHMGIRGPTHTLTLPGKQGAGIKGRHARAE